MPIQQGSKILSADDGSEIRADIVVYTSKKACLERDQGNILFVVECKKPNATEGYAQLVSYIFNTSAVGGVWTNGTGINVYKKKTGGEVGLDEILSLPRYRENWLGNDSIPTNAFIRNLRKNLSILLETIKEIKAELDKPQSAPVIIPLQRYFDMRNAKAYSQKARVSNLKELSNMANYLKASNIYTMNNIRNRAEEMVLRELVYGEAMV